MNVTATPCIVITPGEPAGIGPDITLQIAQQSWDAKLVVICDPELLHQRAEQLNLPITIQSVDNIDNVTAHTPGVLFCKPVKLAATCIPGKLNRDNASYVLTCLEVATDLCLKQKAQALVTGPVQKSIINEAGISFTGHTEFLAMRCGATHPVMLFVTPSSRVALASIHLPLAQVSQTITPHHLMNTLRILNAELKNKFKISAPQITVCGLNPHAGENGHLGHEEIQIITPALEQLRKEGLRLTGPLPADTVFTQKHLKSCDAILAMYHDQALPVVKFMSFGHAVNVTLGLPIIRTSVDHGTALDIAGIQQADAGSMMAALKLAIELAH